MSKLKKCGVNKIPIEKQLYAYGAINPLMIKSKIRSDITCEESRKCVKADFMPIAQPTRRLPFNIRKSVEEKLCELEEMDVIERVEGPTEWVSPLVVVPKRNSEIRICVDMRRANEAVKRSRHPIPTVDEILQELNGAKVYSKIDLRMGFHQVELEPESRNITTFTTHVGLFRYKRLMFGISCAPEMYQQCIKMALEGCAGQRNISDDTIVYGCTQQEHDERLNKVLDRMRDKGLRLNKDKCKFNMDKMTFMGHLLSAKGISPEKSKVEAVISARNPKTTSEVRSFLDFNAETYVIVDASPVGLGAILSQKQSDGNFRPVTFASRTLTDVEQRYSQTEREALAVVWGCERFHLYLYGKEIILVTDHKPLEVIYSPKSKPPARIERWAMRLQPYTFKVKYKPGLPFEIVASSR
ncbi:unnamed protein product [Mytilus coruscus]|uniref:Reverse transcriptase domain-containing protein n=1 Tax=Mytilus coruscus TaxID=42192 RepID=A0A6J8CI93_MYTCO|nr:unnamed protein product [Mytilus coruscus]